MSQRCRRRMNSFCKSKIFRVISEIFILLFAQAMALYATYGPIAGIDNRTIGCKP